MSGESRTQPGFKRNLARRTGVVLPGEVGGASASAAKQAMQTRTGLTMCRFGIAASLLEHLPQNTFPQLRQWCRRSDRA